MTRSGGVVTTAPRPTRPPPPLDVDPDGPVTVPLQAVNPTTTTAMATICFIGSALRVDAARVVDWKTRAPRRRSAKIDLRWRNTGVFSGARAGCGVASEV